MLRITASKLWTISKTELWMGGKRRSQVAIESGERRTKELHVVLMDVEMPIMDGLTCTKEIRRLESEGVLVGHVPIIAVTANARKEQVEEAGRAGVHLVIAKSLRIIALKNGH